MMGEWQTARIEDVAEKVACGPFGSSIKVSTFVPEGIPVISGEHLRGTRLDETSGYNYISPDHADRLKNANVFPGDVIFTHAGNIGQAAYVPSHPKFSRYIISQRQFFMRCDHRRVLPEYVAYFFASPLGRHRLLANSSSVGVPSIAQPVSYLRSIEIPIPPLPEQRAIAHILGTLDDKIELDEGERPRIDPDFEDITETEETTAKERLKRKWSRLEAMVGTGKRLRLVARDIVEHLERRQEAMDGKAMIVCMSRRICVDLYDRIVELRPQWGSQDFDRGAIKVVMTGAASDPERYARHLMTSKVRKEIERRFKKPEDPLKLVIVRDMWLTGFDVPCLHTMYLDKPMQGHGLMQTIARVNRVFRDKPGGLIVDYLGIAEELKQAVATYTDRGGRGKPTYDQNEAVALMLEKQEILCGIYAGFDWSPFNQGHAAQRLTCLKAGVEHVLAIQDGKDRVLLYARQLSEAFALSVPHPEAMRIRDDVAWFQAVRSSLVKLGGGGGGRGQERDVEAAIKQLVSKSVSSAEVVDIFKAAGLDKPDISILSDEFLDQFKRMEQRNLAVEMLRRLMSDEIRKRSKSNLIQSRQCSELLEETIRRYQNRTIEAAAVIEELIRMAKDFNKAMARGEKLGLTDDEVAFYDALGTNDSAVQALGDETLKTIAQELVKNVRRSVTIDWTLKETVRAKIRVMVKRILRKYGYPPDMQEQATQTVLQQAELLCGDWADVPTED